MFHRYFADNDTSVASALGGKVVHVNLFDKRQLLCFPTVHVAFAVNQRCRNVAFHRSFAFASRAFCHRCTHVYRSHNAAVHAETFRHGAHRTAARQGRFHRGTTQSKVAIGGVQIRHHRHAADCRSLYAQSRLRFQRKRRVVAVVGDVQPHLCTAHNGRKL